MADGFFDVLTLGASFILAITIATTGVGKGLCTHKRNLCAPEQVTTTTTLPLSVSKIEASR